SERLGLAAQEHAQIAGIDLGLPQSQPSSSQITIPDDLECRARDLPGLFRSLKVAPRGTEERWLEESSVQRGLVKALCTANDLDLKWCCAAWLRRSSLTRMVQLELFPPRRVAAWEALAQIACD